VPFLIIKHISECFDKEKGFCFPVYTFLSLLYEEVKHSFELVVSSWCQACNKMKNALRNTDAWYLLYNTAWRQM